MCIRYNAIIHDWLQDWLDTRHYEAWATQTWHTDTYGRCGGKRSITCFWRKSDNWPQVKRSEEGYKKSYGYCERQNYHVMSSRKSSHTVENNIPMWLPTPQWCFLHISLHRASEHCRSSSLWFLMALCYKLQSPVPWSIVTIQCFLAKSSSETIGPSEYIM